MTRAAVALGACLVLGIAVGCPTSPTMQEGGTTVGTGSNTESAAGTTTAEFDSDSSTTEPLPECGNGLVEDGEDCDGNSVVGVPCPTDCAFTPGKELWTHVLPYFGESDRPRAIVFGDDDTFYLTGEALTSAEPDALRPGYVARYDVDGTPVWETRPAERFGPSYWALDLVGDQIVVVGLGREDSTRALVVHGLSADDGTPLWTDEKVAEWPLNEIYPGSVVEAPSGRAWISYSEVYMSPDLTEPRGPGFLLEYNDDGERRATHALPPPENPRVSTEGSYELGPRLRVGLDGDLYVAGSASLPGTRELFVQRRTQPDSPPLWEYAARPTADTSLRDLSLALDGAPSVLTTSLFDEDNVTVISLDASGHERWTVELSDNDPDPNGLAVAKDGSVYASFAEEDDSARLTVFTHKYAPDGTFLWEDTYSPSAPETPWIYIHDLVLAPSGAVVMVGFLGGPEVTYRGFVRALAP